MRVSIVIPLFNEGQNVEHLAREVAAVLPSLGEAEAILVDDGSTDGTWTAIEKSRILHPGLRSIRHPANAGQSAAMLTGLRAARGDILVTLDGDLQNNPSDIPALVARLSDCDAVCGYRKNRQDTWSRRAGSLLANRVRNWVTHDGMRDIGCSLKAFKKECLADLPPLNGVHRFMPAYFMLNGRKLKEIPVDHRPRRFGVSKYTNLKRLPRTLFDLFGFLWYRARFLKKPG